jgi:hypothetical protein
MKPVVDVALMFTGVFNCACMPSQWRGSEIDGQGSGEDEGPGLGSLDHLPDVTK